MFILFLVVFIDLIGFGIVIPLLPFYAEYYQATPNEVVWVIAIYSLAQFIAAPYWGSLSDRLGRKPILLVTLAGGVIAYLFLAFANSFLFLLLTRAFSGFMAGNISTAFACMADITKKEDRAKGMGLLGAAFGGGFIIGPAIGGLLAGADLETADFQTPALVAAGISFLACLLAFFKLPESLPVALRKQARMELGKTSFFRQLIADISRPKTRQLIFLSFLTTFVFAGIESTFAMWSLRTFEWGPLQNGYLFAGIGLVSVAIQGGLIGRLVKRFGERNLVLQGSIALALGLFLIPFSYSIFFLIVAMIIVVYGFSLLGPSLNSLISKATRAQEQGRIMGAMRAVATLARIVGPLWAGYIFAWLGQDWPYYTGAMLILGVVVLLLKNKPS